MINIREIWMKMKDDRFRNRIFKKRLKREDDKKNGDSKNTHELKCIKDDF